MSNFYFDNETIPFRPGMMIPPLVCLTYTTAPEIEPEVLHIRDTDSYLTIKSALLGDELIIGHNVAFDLAGVANQWPDLLPSVFEAYDDGRIRCTQVSQKLKDIALGIHGSQPASLQSLVEKYYDVHLEKEDTWRLRYGELLDIAVQDWPDEAVKYAQDDVTWTARVWSKIGPQADDARQAAHSFWIYLMSAWGVATDRARVDLAVGETKVRLAEAHGRLVDAGIVRANGSKDTKAAKARMIRVMETLERPVKLTDTGNVSLDEDACKSSADPLLLDYTEFSKASSTMTKLEKLYHPIIQARFVSLVDTGRTSCQEGSQENGFQLQNPPRKGRIRECFVPRPGYVFASSDLDTAELRAFAQICLWVVGWSKMAEALNAGIDPHWMLAANLLEIHLSASDYEKPEHQDARQLAKIPNFGFLGLMGAPAFVDYARGYGRIITEKFSYRIREIFLATWPEAPYYFKWALEQDGTIVQFKSGRVRSNLGATESANSPFQGLVGDAAKAAGWMIAKETYMDQGTALYGSRTCIFAHDEFILEVPEATAHEAAMRLGEVITTETSRWMPDIAQKTTPVLMRRWIKGCKPKYENGRLVPVDLEVV